MKDTKWVDIRLGEHIFTVHCRRHDDDCFGVTVSFDIYEPHEHPTNFLKRFLEFWKYEQFADGKWIEGLSDDSLRECIIGTCLKVIKSNEKHFDAIKEWESL